MRSPSNSGLFNASRVIGPAAGEAWIYVGLAPRPVFALNGASYLAAIARRARHPTSHPTSAASQQRGWAEMLGGFAYIGSDRRVMILFMLDDLLRSWGWDRRDDPRIAHAGREYGRPGLQRSSLACRGVGATVGAFWMASFSTSRAEGAADSRRPSSSQSRCGPSDAIVAGGTGCGSRPSVLATASVCLFGVGFGAVLFYAFHTDDDPERPPDHLRRARRDLDHRVSQGRCLLGSLLTGQVASRYGVTFAMTVSSCIAQRSGCWAVLPGSCVRLPSDRLSPPSRRGELNITPDRSRSDSAGRLDGLRGD